MNRFLFIIIAMLVVLVHVVGAFEEATIVVQKKLAFTQLRESGLSLEEAEKYSTVMQEALQEATQLEVIDYAVTAALIAERGGTPKCANLQCAIVNGQLLNADYICIGSIETIGPTFSLTIQVADINSGRMVANVSKFFKGKEKVFVTRTIPLVAKQVATTIVGKKNVVRNSGRKSGETFERMVNKQANSSFGDMRGYLNFGTGEEEIETGDKLAFGYLSTGMGMKPDDGLRYSYQLQSYLADVGACAMLYIDEMERLMKVRGGNLKCKDKRCAKNVGKLLGVNYMGYGKISKFFGFYFVSADIIDVEDGKRVIRQKRNFRGKEITFLTESIPQLAYKLGEVLERKAIAQEK